MYIEKPKRKSQSFDWESGNGAVNFTFDTLISIDECVERLQARHNMGLFANPRIKVEVQPIDVNTYEFRVRRYASKQTGIVATGFMRYVDKGTLVEGEVRYSSNIYWQYLAFIVLGLFFMFFPSGHVSAGFTSLVGVFFAVFGTVMTWMISERNRSQMLNLIQESLRGFTL